MATLDIKKMLPFLEDEQINKLLEKCEVDGEYKGITIEQLFPFLSDEKIDELFRKYAFEGKNISKIIPFVSDEAMHKIVDDYIAGNSSVDINQVLPMLEEDDVKKLFDYEMNK